MLSNQLEIVVFNPETEEGKKIEKGYHVSVVTTSKNGRLKTLYIHRDTGPIVGHIVGSIAREGVTTIVNSTIIPGDEMTFPGLHILHIGELVADRPEPLFEGPHTLSIRGKKSDPGTNLKPR